MMGAAQPFLSGAFQKPQPAKRSHTGRDSRFLKLSGAWLKACACIVMVLNYRKRLSNKSDKKKKWMNDQRRDAASLAADISTMVDMGKLT